MTIAFLFAVLFAAMLIGVPVAIALGMASVFTILLFANDSLASIALKFFSNASDHYTLLAIPFFILSSAFLSTGGVARRIIDFAMDAVGHIKGGLAMASVLACMTFAAVSGSSPATVAAIGGIVITGMVRAGYTEKFAAGAIANAGTLGILIPPSIVMLVYSAATQVSAAKMFMAGLIPGLMIGLGLMLAIYVVARIRDFPAQPFPGFGALAGSAARASGGLMLIIIVLGSIYGGVASPTEAASVSAVYAFLVCALVYRDMGPLKGIPWRYEREPVGRALGRNAGQMLLAIPRSTWHPEMKATVFEAAKTSIMLLFIIANAMLFAHVLTTERIPHTIAEAIIAWGLPTWGFLLVVNLLLLIAGNFMEPSAILLIMAPILFPIAMKLGIDPIHFGIIMVVNMELGMLTPPVGLNLFVISGITRRPLGWAVTAAAPWLLLMLCFLMVITFVPQISLVLVDILSK